MVNRNEVALAEIEVVAEQQRLTEQEEAEIQRQKHLLEAQIQFAAALQADLDALRVLLLGTSPSHNPNISPTATAATITPPDKG